MTRALIFFFFGVFGFFASAIAEEPVVALSPELEKAALQMAQAQGMRIYLHDRAASIATDEALKIGSFRKEKRVTGWVTEERNEVIQVTFVGGTGNEEPQALYRATVGRNGPIGSAQRLEAPEPLTEFEAGAVAARNFAVGSGFKACSKTYNTVVLPTGVEPDRKWVVYLIPGTTENNVVPVGGTYRVELEWKAQTLIAQRTFTRSCFQLEKRAEAAALVITHLMDPVPTEAHVFWALWVGMPLYVAIAPLGTIWAIDEKGTIRLVERGAPQE